MLASIPEAMSLADFVSLSGHGDIRAVKNRLGDWLASSVFAQGAGVMRSALQSPGTKISTMAAAVDHAYFSAGNAELGCLVVARALGAVEVKIDEKVCNGLWTLNPFLVRELVNIAKRKRAQSEAVLREMCPDMDSDLKTWLLSVIGTSKKRPARTKRR
jgi:hypothetical protein